MSKDEETKRICFISHHANDEEVASSLAERLRGAGISVWLRDADIQPGSVRYNEIENAAQRSHCFVILVGKENHWVSYETAIVRTEADGSGRKVIPILLEDAPSQSWLPASLRAIEPVDLRNSGQGDQAQMQRLIERINERYRPGDKLVRGIKEGARQVDACATPHRQRMSDGNFISEPEYPSGQVERLAERLFSTLDHKEQHTPILKQINKPSALVTALVTACHDHQPSLIAQHLLIRFIAERKEHLWLDDHPVALERPNAGWIDAGEFEALLIAHFGRQTRTLADVARRIDEDEHLDGQWVLYVPIDANDQFWWMLPHRIAAAESALEKLKQLLEERRKPDDQPIRLVVLFGYLVKSSYFPPLLGRARHCRARRYWTSLLALGLRWTTRNCVWSSSTRMIEAGDFHFWPLPWLEDVIEEDLRRALEQFKHSLNSDPERKLPDPWDSTWHGRLLKHLKADLAKLQRPCRTP